MRRVSQRSLRPRPGVQPNPQVPILKATEANVREAIPNVGHSQGAPNVAPRGMLEDAPNDPGLFGWAAATHQVAHLVFADVIVPKEIRTVAGVSDCFESRAVRCDQSPLANMCQGEYNHDNVSD